jgi:hypothetical protein
VRRDNKAAVALGSERRHGSLDLICVMHSKLHQLNLERGSPCFSKFEEVKGVAGVSGPEMQAEQRRTNEPIKLIRKLRCIRLEAQAKPVWMLGATVVAD